MAQYRLRPSCWATTSADGEFGRLPCSLIRILLDYCRAIFLLPISRVTIDLNWARSLRASADWCRPLPSHHHQSIMPTFIMGFLLCAEPIFSGICFDWLGLLLLWLLYGVSVWTTWCSPTDMPYATATPSREPGLNYGKFNYLNCSISVRDARYLSFFLHAHLGFLKSRLRCCRLLCPFRVHCVHFIELSSQQTNFDIGLD